MNEKALRILEYDKIINMLAGFAVSPMAKEMAHHLQPSVSMSEIVLRQQETTEAVRRFSGNPSPAETGGNGRHPVHSRIDAHWGISLCLPQGEKLCQK